MKEEIISFEDFAKINMQTATINEVEEIENADKLYKLKINLGEEERIICAGIKEFYSIEELKGKQIIVVANLEPRKMRGIESQGMLLAADENGKPILISPEKKIKNGTKIR